MVQAVAEEIAAGIACLEGRRDAALEGYRRALATLRRLSAPFFLALVELDIVLVMGTEEPETRAAAEEAREIFARLGATPFLEKLEAALAGAVAQQVP